MSNKRSGTVAAINSVTGMVAIKTHDDGFTVIELIEDWDLEIGDELIWNNGYGLGSETYINVSNGAQAEVCVQNHSVTQAMLRQQLKF